MKSNYTKYQRSLVALQIRLVRLSATLFYVHALKILLLQYYTQIGLNLVTAAVQSHIGEINLAGLFEAYGKLGTIKTVPLPQETVHFKPLTAGGSTTPTQNAGSGLYWTRYTTSVVPSKNSIEAWGEADIQAPEIFYNSTEKIYMSRTQTPEPKTVRLRSGQTAYFDETGAPHAGYCIRDNNTHEVYCYQDNPEKFDSYLYTVYGVDVSLVIEPNIVLLNEDGQTTADMTFKYTILPPDYNVLIADVDIFKTDATSTDAWISYIPVDKTQGQGSAGYVKGSKFDINSLYKAQVVLSRGTDIEIKSRTEINTDNIGNNDSVCEQGEACMDKVPIPLAQLRVLTDESFPKEADEIKFSDGSNNSNGTKKYHIQIKSQSWLSSCESLTGRIVTLSTSTASMGQPVSTPQNTGSAYAAEYPLAFNHPLLPLGNRLCNVQIVDTLDNGSRKDKFILSNRSRTALDVGLPYSNIYNTAVVYGGIGNKFWLEVGGVGKELPIEPVGVIVLAIDGLRQDVLYKPLEQQVYPVGVLSPYYVPSTELTGLCEVLGGKYNGPGSIPKCNDIEMSLRNIRLQNVTTIFPSITFAAWASIYTGLTPSATGITGNEFFGRDLIRYDAGTSKYLWLDQVPGLSYPLGMITLDADGGAFRPLIKQKPFSWVESAKSLPFLLHHIMPAEITGFGYDTPADKKASSAPNRALRATPLWNEINAMTSNKYKYDQSGTARCRDTQYECRTAAFLNQYTRGADPYLFTDGVDWWGTPSNSATELMAAATSIDWPLSFDSAEVMDKTAAEEAAGFISDYFAHNNQGGKRKRFPAVFSVYLSGLDHKAHVAGMSEYRNYFMEKTNDQVKNIVDALKGKDEFDNKIFIVVSDHGETQMPTELTYKKTKVFIDPESGIISDPWQEDEVINMSCALKTDFQDNPNDPYAGKNAMNDELSNNNLHIWELGEMFSAMGGIEDASVRTKYKLLVPGEIEDAFVNNGVPDEFSPTSDIDEADIVAALNGPMAHIYSMVAADNKTLGEIAEAFRVMLSGSFSDEAVKWYGFSDQYSYMKFRVKYAGRLRNSVDKILIRLEDGKYYVFGGLDDNGEPVTYSLSSSLSGLDYVDGETRVNGMNNKSRSGDIVLIMKDDVYYPDNESISDHRFTTGVACKSWHGSLNRSDSYVPFIFAYPGGNSNELEQILKKDTICKSDYSGCKANWKLPDIVKEIISTQYK